MMNAVDTVGSGRIGRALETAAKEVVDRTREVTLWEWDYTLWISMKLAVAIAQQEVASPHERILNNHGIEVKDLRELFGSGIGGNGPMAALLRKHLTPPEGRRLNGITADLQVFAGCVVDNSAIDKWTFVERPRDGMPPVQALVEIKVPVGVPFRSIKFSKDIAKLALSGEFYHQKFGHQRPYLGAWILDVKEHFTDSTLLGWLSRRLDLGTPGTEHVPSKRWT